MKKRPFLIASALLAGIFVFFLVLALTVASFTGRPNQFALGDKVGVVEVFGIIADAKKTIEQLHEFNDDDSIKAIVLRVDSPGGGVGPSQEIYDEVKVINQAKPVVVSMGSVAASGGYYIAAPARLIYANPGTITGSIGVIMEFTNFEELLEKIGMRSEVVKSGQHKDIGSPTRPMTEADKAILQAMINDVHDQFVVSVAKGRSMDEAEVRELADGRIFTGRQAKEFGLVDELGNLKTAIKRAAELGGISGEPKVIYPEQEKPRLIDYLIQETISQVETAIHKQRVVGLQYLWEGVQ